MPRHNNDDAFDENGVLKDGRSVRVALLMMDGKTQRSVSLSDGLGNRAGNCPGYVMLDNDDRAEHRQQMYDFQKAELSARWKGGLTEGDTLKLGDRTMEV